MFDHKIMTVAFPTWILSVGQLISARAPRAPMKLDLEKNSIEKLIVACNTECIAVRCENILRVMTDDSTVRKRMVIFIFDYYFEVGVEKCPYLEIVKTL
jgi:hypothetical protein